MAIVYLSLGSNLGQRLQFLKKAIRSIEKTDEISIKKVSPVYETQPVGYDDQKWFLNLVIEVQTNFDPLSLLEYLSSIEKQMGRNREVKWGPRNIDIDILLYNNQVVDSKELTMPHPLMHERRFVLTPLAQIAPQLLHPILEKSVEELLRICKDKSIVRLFPKRT